MIMEGSKSLYDCPKIAQESEKVQRLSERRQRRASALKDLKESLREERPVESK